MGIEKLEEGCDCESRTWPARTELHTPPMKAHLMWVHTVVSSTALTNRETSDPYLRQARMTNV